MTREILLMTPEQVELHFELAGIGSRFIALFVDTVLVGLLLFATTAALVVAGIFSAVGSTSALPGSIMIAIFILVYFGIYGGYFLYFEAAKNGQTPGKKSVGIRVIRDTGHPVDFRSALIRNAMRIVDWLPGFYGVAIVSAFFNPEYRRLGDYVAGTLVVKVGRITEEAKGKSSLQPGVAKSEVAAMQSDQVPSALPAQAMAHLADISRDDYRVVRHFLDRKSELEAGVVGELAKKLAEPMAHKLQLEFAQIEDHAAFLEAISREWERRLVH